MNVAGSSRGMFTCFMSILWNMEDDRCLSLSEVYYDVWVVLFKLQTSSGIMDAYLWDHVSVKYKKTKTL